MTQDRLAGPVPRVARRLSPSEIQLIEGGLEMARARSGGSRSKGGAMQTAIVLTVVLAVLLAALSFVPRGIQIQRHHVGLVQGKQLLKTSPTGGDCMLRPVFVQGWIVWLVGAAGGEEGDAQLGEHEVIGSEVCQALGACI